MKPCGFDKNQILKERELTQRITSKTFLHQLLSEYPIHWVRTLLQSSLINQHFCPISINFNTNKIQAEELTYSKQAEEMEGT